MSHLRSALLDKGNEVCIQIAMIAASIVMGLVAPAYLVAV